MKSTTASRNIIGFYGSFTHSGTCNVVLEYADKGNLEDYLQSVPPPTKPEDIITFWEGLLHIAQGLLTIHGQQDPLSDGPQMLLGFVNISCPQLPSLIFRQVASRSKAIKRTPLRPERY